MENFFDKHKDSKDIDFNHLFSGPDKITGGQEAMIEHLLETARGLDETKRRMIGQEYRNYTEEQATEEIRYLKEYIPIRDCRDQFKKMCKDGVFS